MAAQARAMLFSQALEAGEVDQAEEWFQGLPPQPLYDKSSMQARLALARKDWATAGEQWEGNLLHQIGQVQSTLLSLMDLAAQEGQKEAIAPMAEAACALTEVFGLWPYGTWSVRLQQALLTEDAEGALTALEGLLDALDRPWVGPSSAAWAGRRRPSSPPSSARPSSGNSRTRTILPMTCSGTPLGFGRWWRKRRAEWSPLCANEAAGVLGLHWRGWSFSFRSSAIC